MTIIEQLETSVSIPVLGAETSIDHISLLEQFYAVMIARLSVPQAYTQLLQANHQHTTKPVINHQPSSSLFEQLWQSESQQQLMINELTLTHHIDEESTRQLLNNAAPLAYQELKNLANGQFLPAFLQQQQSAIRHYLPVWAESVITDIDDICNNDSNTVNSSDSKIEISKPTIAADDRSTELADPVAVTSLNAISADSSIDPSATVLSSMTPIPTNEALVNNRKVANINDAYGVTRKRNKRNDTLLRLFLLIGAIAAFALLWVFVVQPDNVTVDEPVVVELTPVAAPIAVVAATMPVSLTVAVDNSGSLYTCTATVGDAALQNTLREALASGFGEQANICNLTIDAQTSNTFANIDSSLLTRIFTMLKSTPFARMQLQNNLITLEAPNELYLQRLLTDMQAMLPTTTITTSAPIASASNLEDAMSADQTMNQSMTDANNQYGSGITPEFLNNLDSPPAMNADTASSNRNDSDGNNFNNSNNNNVANRFPANTSQNIAPNNNNSGRLSEADVDDLANNVIVAEQLRNESRVESNVVPNNQQ